MQSKTLRNQRYIKDSLAHVYTWNNNNIPDIVFYWHLFIFVAIEPNYDRHYTMRKKRFHCFPPYAITVNMVFVSQSQSISRRYSVYGRVQITLAADVSKSHCRWRKSGTCIDKTVIGQQFCRWHCYCKPHQKSRTEQGEKDQEGWP